MKRFFGFCGILTCFLAGLIYLGCAQSGADDILQSYQKKASFSSKEMMYHSVTRPVAKKGLVFFKPTFPSWPGFLHADKMILTMIPEEIRIRLSRMELNIGQTLVQQHKQSLTEKLQKFQAPDDFLLKPLMGLALLNQDTAKGTLDLVLRPNGTTMVLEARFLQNGVSVGQLYTVITLPASSSGRLWGWLDGTIQSVTVQIEDMKLLQAASVYFAGIRQDVPLVLKQALNTGKPLSVTISLPNPVTVEDLFN